MLTLDGVSKVYRIGAFGGKSLQAVRGVSFDLRPGEIVSLIGESGSGKSTIGRMILRLDRVTSGTISFDGGDIGRSSANQRFIETGAGDRRVQRVVSRHHALADGLLIRAMCTAINICKDEHS